MIWLNLRIGAWHVFGSGYRMSLQHNNWHCKKPDVSYDRPQMRMIFLIGPFRNQPSSWTWNPRVWPRRQNPNWRYVRLYRLGPWEWPA
jgi:hypothetical protein